ncbi:hypothetical protein LTR53_008471 [Teratosphaeriaceae sp. CCFEE 6253]|nr:hypothetical protein LTR53_008471 [Teratosphaeriaceae sp. CCFEE 6253]
MFRRIRNCFRARGHEQYACDLDRQLQEGFANVLREHLPATPDSIVKRAAHDAAHAAITSRRIMSVLIEVCAVLSLTRRAGRTDWTEPQPRTVEDKLEECMRPLFREDFPYTRASLLSRSAYSSSHFAVDTVRWRSSTSTKACVMFDSWSYLRRFAT